jgi:hypothetical protein
MTQTARNPAQVIAMRGASVQRFPHSENCRYRSRRGRILAGGAGARRCLPSSGTLRMFGGCRSGRRLSGEVTFRLSLLLRSIARFTAPGRTMWPGRSRRPQGEEGGPVEPGGGTDAEHVTMTSGRPERHGRTPFSLVATVGAAREKARSGVGPPMRPGPVLFAGAGFPAHPAAPGRTPEPARSGRVIRSSPCSPHRRAGIHAAGDRASVTGRPSTVTPPRVTVPAPGKHDEASRTAHGETRRSWRPARQWNGRYSERESS